MSHGVRIYKAGGSERTSVLDAWSSFTSNILGSRELIWQLFNREFLAGYRKSFLGTAWIILSPLLTSVMWVALQQSGLLRPGDAGIPYPVYVLTGTTVWGLFVGLYEGSEKTLVAGSDFLMQVSYPHEVLLVQQAAQALVNFTVAFAMNLIVMAIFGFLPAWQAVFFPLVALPMLLLAAGTGLVFSLVAVISVDVRRASALVLTLLIWASPIVYTDAVSNPVVRLVNKWNPLTYLVCSARDVILFGRLYNPPAFVASTVFAVVVFLISSRLFLAAKMRVVERIQ